MDADRWWLTINNSYSINSSDSILKINKGLGSHASISYQFHTKPIHNPDFFSEIKKKTINKATSSASESSDIPSIIASLFCIQYFLLATP